MMAKAAAEKDKKAQGAQDEKAKEDAKTKAKAVAPPVTGWRKVLDYVRSIGLALLLALVIRQFIIQAFRIPTGSMERTLLVGDFLFVNKFLYGAKTPERIRFLGATLVKGLPVLKLPALRQPRQGDIIVFQFPEDLDLDYIKRCVAVAGDTVEVRDGVLYVNGEIYESNFAERDGDHSCVPDWQDPEGCPKPRTYHDPARLRFSSDRNRNFGPVVVPEGKIFMMGDNRFNSLDSRYWGPLDVDLVKGKALFIYWSWDKTRMRPRLERLGDLIR
jgi:signal peptidase I